MLLPLPSRIQYGSLTFSFASSQFLLKATASSDLSTFDLGALASHRLNGRDIKHTVQTAQAVALMEKEPLAMSHLEEVLTVAKSGLMLQGA